MRNKTSSELTDLLNHGFNGDADAGALAFSLIYQQLKRTATAQLGSSGQGATLSPTALVNETYLKLISGGSLALNDRVHFFSLAARAMKQLLIDHQRMERCAKHGGDLQRVELDDELLDESNRGLDYLDLECARLPAVAGHSVTKVAAEPRAS